FGYRQGGVYLKTNVVSQAIGEFPVFQHFPGVVYANRDYLGGRGLFDQDLQAGSMELFRFSCLTSGPFGKNYRSPIVFFDIGPQFGNLRQRLFAVLSIYEYRSPVSKVIRYAGDALSQFHFTDKFGMVLSHKPYYRWDIVHALVVQYNYSGSVRRYIMCVFEG